MWMDEAYPPRPAEVNAAVARAIEEAWRWPTSNKGSAHRDPELMPRMRALQAELIRIHLPRMAPADAQRAQRTLAWLQEVSA